MVASKTNKNYFSIVSILILMLTVTAFSDNLFTDVGQPSNRDPKFIIHGIFCLAWTVFFAVQSNLVRVGNRNLHITLGIAGMVTAVGVVLSTLYVFTELWNGWGALRTVAKLNRLLLPACATSLLLAWRHRKRPDLHKRFVYVFTLYMLEPVVSRASGKILDPLLYWAPDQTADLACWAFMALVPNAFFISLLIFDFKDYGRVHPVSLSGYLVAWMACVAAVIL